MGHEIKFRIFQIDIDNNSFEVHFAAQNENKANSLQRTTLNDPLRLAPYASRLAPVARPMSDAGPR
ncbi:hypothetical protein GCM10009077_14190 [Roseibium denhamense]